MKSIDVNHVQMYKAPLNYTIIQDAIHRTSKNINITSFKYISPRSVPLNTN
jgi:hypothetical protein